jgi:hypothetical protein
MQAGAPLPKFRVTLSSGLTPRPSAPLLCELREKFLSALERCDLSVRSALCVHREEHGPDQNAHDAGRDVLSCFQSSLSRQVLNLQIIRFDLGCDHRAIAVRVVRLNDCDRLGITARTSAEQCCNSCGQNT